jgi:hypothetical protein
VSATEVELLRPGGHLAADGAQQWGGSWAPGVDVEGFRERCDGLFGAGNVAAKALEFVVAGVGGAVEVQRDASAYVALDVDGLLSALSGLIDVADLVACGALLVDQCASGLVDAGRVSSCELEPTVQAAAAMTALQGPAPSVTTRLERGEEIVRYL